MREARKRAIAQKKERRAYQAQLAAKDFKWGGSGPSEAELRNSKTVKVSKERTETSDTIDLEIDFEVGNVAARKLGIRGNIRTNMSEEEYQAREEAAQQEIDRKRGQVAPAFNKGAYQYITSRDQVKDVYKK